MKICTPRAAHSLVLLVIMTMIAMPLAAVSSEQITIIGEVNESYQIVANDGQIYEVADTDAGIDLIDNQIGQKVKVTGTVEEENEIKTIAVEFYEILSE